MKVTKVFFHKLNKPGSKLKAFANVEFDDTMFVKGFKVFEGTNGPFVKPPQQQSNDSWYDTIQWSDKAFYEEGASPHPILLEVCEEWKKFNSSQRTTQATDEKPRAW